jgi:4-aminobutyrate aminotransferase / (S)-3-amino-2-methylpropionate transaminase / 5-aminovalerate transaminase
VAGRPDVMDLAPLGSMTSTHTGNPVCCAAALASIDLVVNEDLAGNARAMGAVLHDGLRRIKERFRQIGQVHGKGLVAGVLCVHPGTKKPDGDLAWEVVRLCFEKGLLLFTPVGVEGGTVKIAPPLTITCDAMAESLQVMEEAFGEATQAR